MYSQRWPTRPVTCREGILRTSIYVPVSPTSLILPRALRSGVAVSPITLPSIFLLRAMYARSVAFIGGMEG